MANLLKTRQLKRCYQVNAHCPAPKNVRRTDLAQRSARQYRVWRADPGGNWLAIEPDQQEQTSRIRSTVEATIVRGAFTKVVEAGKIMVPFRHVIASGTGRPLGSLTPLPT